MIFAAASDFCCTFRVLPGCLKVFAIITRFVLITHARASLHVLCTTHATPQKKFPAITFTKSITRKFLIFLGANFAGVIFFSC
jgi:hypothetical protein